jgi:hypothetical protein
MNLHDHLAELAVAIEVATSRQEALAALAQYLASDAAAQLSRQGQNVLIDIISTKIASLPDDSAPVGLIVNRFRRRNRFAPEWIGTILPQVEGRYG